MRLGLHFDLTVPFARYVAGERRPPVVPVPAPPDPEGVARRATAGGSLPRVHPGRHRRRRRRRAGPALRGRDAAGHRRGLPQAPRRPDGHPGQQPQDPRGLLPRHRHRRRRPAPCAIVDKLDKIGPAKVKDHARRGRPHAGAGRPGAWRWRRSGPRTCPSSSRCGRSASSTRPSTKGSTRWPRSSRRAWTTPRGARRRPARSRAASTTTPAPSTRPQLVGLRVVGLVLLRRALRLARLGRQDHLPRASGISIGVSRLLGLLHRQGPAAPSSRSTPACVLVAVNDEESRAGSTRVATELRARGIPCEVAPKPAKFGKQIRYAERRGIPYVWFPGGAGSRRDGGRLGQGHPVRRPGRRRRHLVAASGSRTCDRRSSASES